MAISRRHLFLYHDEYRSFSFGDFQKTAHLFHWAAYENLYIIALQMGLETSYEFFPENETERLVAAISFNKAETAPKPGLINF